MPTMQLRNQSEPVESTRLHNAPVLLLAFVAVSVLLHSAALLLTTEPIPVSPSETLGTRIISTVLVANTNSDLPTPKQSRQQTSKAVASSSSRKITKNIPAIITSAAHKTESDIKRALHTNSAPGKPELVKAPEKIEQTPSSTSAVSLSLQMTIQRNFLAGELQNRLSEFLTYPQRARRRGWQGEVRVAFHINAHGQLNNVRLAQSSGYALLDRSALLAIAKLGYITLPDTLGILQPMDMLLPVSYQLRES